MNRPGTTLIEFMIALGIISFAALISVQLLQWYRGEIAVSAQRNDQILSVHLARTLLSRDIKKAPINQQKWKAVDEDQIVWSRAKEEGDLGWCFTDHGLCRVTGIYNSDRKRWEKKSLHVVARSIEACTFMVRKDSPTTAIGGVTISLRYDGQSEEWFIMPREGAVV